MKKFKMGIQEKRQELNNKLNGKYVVEYENGYYVSTDADNKFSSLKAYWNSELTTNPSFNKFIIPSLNPNTGSATGGYVYSTLADAEAMINKLNSYFGSLDSYTALCLKEIYEADNPDEVVIPDAPVFA